MSFTPFVLVSQHKLFNEHLVSASGNPALVMRRKKHTEKEVHADLISVVSVRLREGYTIRDISLTKGKRLTRAPPLLPERLVLQSSSASLLLSSGGSQLEVKLVLLWKHNMHIEYLAAASWPLEPTKRTTRVEVTMEGSYDILHDISCTQRKPITSPYRTSVIRRFWNTLQRCNTRESVLDTAPRFIGERVVKCGCQTTTRMFALSASTRRTRCWCTFSLLTPFQRTT